jgi:large subunit ribosomal protein L32e
MKFMVSKRKHPKFLRPNYGRSSRSRIKLAWRRPRGIDNKKRLKIAYMGASPSIGYGQPSVLKHLHPSGLPETLVQTPADLSGLKEVAVRIASGVGRRKREEIIRLAESMKLPVLNKSKKYPVKVAKVEAKKGGKKEGKKEEKKAEAPRAAEAKAEEKKPEAKAEAKEPPKA